MIVQQRLTADVPSHVSSFDPFQGIYRSYFKRAFDILLVLMALPVVLLGWGTVS